MGGLQNSYLIKKVGAVCHSLQSYRCLYWVLWILFFFGASSVAVHRLHHTQIGVFYQSEFAPAVMQACGRGFYNIKPQPGAEELGAFLRTERPSIACTDLPQGLMVSEPDAFQKVHRYLFATVAAIWALLGVSWGAVMYLNAALFAVTLILCYALSRLVLGQFTAWIPVALFAMSRLHLEQLPHLRDYAKAPIMLGMLWLTVLLLLNKTAVGRLRLAAVLGLLAGLGVGFRMDILLMIPFVVASVLLFSGISWTRPGLWQRVRILGVFGLVFFVVGAPILVRLGQGGNTLHVILLGLAPEFDYALGLPTTAHDLLERYNDAFLNALLSLWNDPGGAPLGLASRNYEEVGLQYLLRLIDVFPADFLLRTLSASLAIMFYGIPTLLREQLPISWLYSPLVASPFLICFAWACDRSARIGLFLLFAVAYLFGSTVLQFASRHWFYLQAAAFGFLVFASWLTVQMVPTFWRQAVSVVRRRSLKAVELRPIWISVVPVLVLMSVIFSLFFLLRDYQLRHGEQILEQYRRLPVAGVPVIKEIDSYGVNYRFDFEKGARSNAGGASRQETSFSAAYVVAEFDPVRCGRENVHFRIGYQTSNPYLDFSRSVSLNLAGQTKYYFPIFDFSNSIQENSYLHFDGVSMSKASSACLVNIDRVDLASRGLPLLNLPIDAKTLLAPRAFAWQLSEPLNPSYYSNANYYNDLYFEGRKAGMGGGRVEASDPVFRTPSGQHWQLLGYPQGRNVNLINFGADDSALESRVFLLVGKIKRGFIGVGLLENDAWVWSTPIYRQGEFRIALHVTRGQKPIIFAMGRDQNIFLDVDLTYAGWVNEIKR